MSDGGIHIGGKDLAMWGAILGFGGTSIFGIVKGEDTANKEEGDHYEIHMLEERVQDLESWKAKEENINQVQESHIQKNRDDINLMDEIQNDLQYEVLTIQEDIYGY